MSALVVAVAHEERYWYPDDGGIVWVAGYHPVDEDGRFLTRDAAAQRGLILTGVAGAAQHHDDVLQSAGAEPGAPLLLRRDPGNPHDPNAIAVDVAAGGGQLGWVPRELAATVAPRMDSDRLHSAVVLRERRASPRDPRTGVTMLIAEAPAIELREVSRPGPARPRA